MNEESIGAISEHNPAIKQMTGSTEEVIPEELKLINLAKTIFLIALGITVLPLIIIRILG